MKIKTLNNRSMTSLARGKGREGEEGGRGGGGRGGRGGEGEGGEGGEGMRYSPPPARKSDS